MLTESIESLHIADDPKGRKDDHGKPKKLEDQISQTHLVKIMRIFSVSGLRLSTLATGHYDAGVHFVCMACQ